MLFRSTAIDRDSRPWFARLVRRKPTAEMVDALEPTIYRFILRYSLREQIYVVVGTLLSFPFLYLSLDLPKYIVNQAIGGQNFPRHIVGFSFDQLPYLSLLCSVFLVLVVINGWFKWHLNVRKGRIGERMLRRLRYTLFERVLRFPMQHFDRTATGQIIAMLTAELEPVGGFVGDSFALPIAQAGTLLTIFVFMFVQNPVLGAAAVALYPVQGYVIPKMQRRIRALGRERVRKMRTLSDRIGEAIASQVEIRTNAGARHQLTDISARLGEIYEIRFDVYNRKFFVKFLNNFLNQLTPFFFYLIGGYFVISGELSFGALVAVLAAYKDLSSPWKELLDFYQNQQDVAIKYEQVVEQFQTANLIDRHLLLDEPESVQPIVGDLVFSNVSVVDGDGIRLLDAVTFTLASDTHAALVGSGNSGKNTVPQLLARLYPPTSGRITLGGADLASLPFTASGRLIGYVGPTTHLLSATIRDNLMLGLRYRPAEPGGDEVGGFPRARAIEEARSSGNIARDFDADWVDYRQAAVSNAAELDRRIGEVLRLVGLDADVYLFGLHGRLDPEQAPAAAARFLEARHRFEEQLRASDIAHFVERFDPARYNRQASIAENLLFGAPIGPTFAADRLADSRYVRQVLDEAGLTLELLGAGRKLAEMMVELLGDLAPEHGLAEEFGLVQSGELAELERVLARLGRVGLDRLSTADQAPLFRLAVKLVAATDRLGLIDAALQQRIVAARRRFAVNLPKPLRDAVEFFDAERYNAAAQVEQNILFGTIVSSEAEARQRVEAAMGEVLDELDLRGIVLGIGLDHLVGTGGSRLSPAQRQQVAIAGAVLKRPRLLALNDATAVLDAATESRVLAAVRGEFAGRSMLIALSRPEIAQGFDRVLAMEQGKLVADGPGAERLRSDAPPALLEAAE
jgi:putative ABC transport system ATP-binding protein